MDKQIIIDGVDITNCIHRATNKLCGDIDPYCRCYTGSCKDIPNCYYKQLQRKEQECEELKEHHYELEEKFLELNVKAYSNSLELDQLKAENEELKNFHINLVGVKECEIKELIKYKQALKEIKEIAIAEDINNECEYTLFGSCAAKAKNQILQKISEVLDD